MTFLLILYDIQVITFISFYFEMTPKKYIFVKKIKNAYTIYLIRFPFLFLVK